MILVNCCSVISQVIIFLKVLKCLISILNFALFCSTLTVGLLVVDLYLSHFGCFGLLRTSSLSIRCRLVSVSIFVALVCSKRRVALLVFDLFRMSQPFLICVEQLDPLCSLFSYLCRLSKFSCCFSFCYLFFFAFIMLFNTYQSDQVGNIQIIYS